MSRAYIGTREVIKDIGYNGGIPFNYWSRGGNVILALLSLHCSRCPPTRKTHTKQGYTACANFDAPQESAENTSTYPVPTSFLVVAVVKDTSQPSRFPTSCQLVLGKVRAAGIS